MSQREALFCLLIAFIMISAGLIWLFGAWAMVGSGLTLGAASLFVIDLTPGKGDA